MATCRPTGPSPCRCSPPRPPGSSPPRPAQRPTTSRADGSWTAPAGGGGGGITTEDAVDAVATALTEGAAIDIAYNDTANTITVAGTTFADAAAGVVPASGGGTVNYLRADGTWTAPPTAGIVSNTATFSYNTTTSEPPTGNQLRLNSTTQSAATRLWISQTTVDGLDVSIGLARILTGHQIYIQDRDDASHWIKYNVTADGVDDGTYYDFAVSYHSGPGAIPAGQVEAQMVAPGTVGVPPGGTTGQALTKDTSTDYDVSWTSVQPLDTDLTTIAGLTATTDNIIQSVGSAWASRTPTQVKTALALNNVDNTTDAAKPVSTATQTALDLKATTAALTAHEADTTAIHGITDTAALVTTARTVSTTAPLSGGGALSSNLTLTVGAAADTATGVVELATAAEVLTGTDTTRAVTAAGATGAFAPKYVAVNAQTGTTYTLVLTDDSKLVTLSNAAAITLTVPANSTVAYPTGTHIDIAQIGAGQVTVTQAGGVTVNATPTKKIRAQYGAATLIKYAADTWLLVGDLATT